MAFEFHLKEFLLNLQTPDSPDTLTGVRSISRSHHLKLIFQTQQLTPFLPFKKTEIFFPKESICCGGKKWRASSSIIISCLFFALQPRDLIGCWLTKPHSPTRKRVHQLHPQKGVLNAPPGRVYHVHLWGCSWKAAISQVHPFAKKKLHPKGCTNIWAFKASLQGILKTKMAEATPLWVH